MKVAIRNGLIVDVTHLKYESIGIVAFHESNPGVLYPIESLEDKELLQEILDRFGQDGITPCLDLIEDTGLSDPAELEGVEISYRQAGNRLVIRLARSDWFFPKYVTMPLAELPANPAFYDGWELEHRIRAFLKRNLR